MEEKRPLYGKRIILAFIIATILFALGFLLSYIVTYSKYQSVSISQGTIGYSLLDLELQERLITSSCNVLGLFSLSTELDEMGSTMGILEKRFGKTDIRVLSQKEIYSMLELQHFLLIKSYSEKCNKSINSILFFYSNEENFADAGEKIGYILDSLKSQKKQVMIYSFDYNLKINLIELLKRNYNITEPNIVIINEKIKLNNINNIKDIQKYIK